MEIMMEPPSRNNYEWILDRIVRLWHLWVAAVKNIEKEEQRPHTQKKASWMSALLLPLAMQCFVALFWAYVLFKNKWLSYNNNNNNNNNNKDPICGLCDLH